MRRICAGNIVRVDMLTDDAVGEDVKQYTMFVGHGIVIEQLCGTTNSTLGYHEEDYQDYDMVGVYSDADLYVVLLFGQGCPQPFFDFELTIIDDICDIKEAEPHVIGGFSKID